MSIERLIQMAKISNREATWNKISRSVFQDRAVSYEKFIDAVINPMHTEHKSITSQSLMMLPSATFIDLLGENIFIKHWIAIKQDVDRSKKSINDSVIVLDCLWSHIATGFAFVKPRASIVKLLPTKMQSTFREISGKSNGISIYDIQKITGRYSLTFSYTILLLSIANVNNSDSVGSVPHVVSANQFIKADCATLPSKAFLL